MQNNVFIIAEIGNTHEGFVGLAKRFICEAAACGADAVKFQTHIFEAESLPDAPNPPYFDGESRKDYFQRTAFSLAQYRELKKHSETCGVSFLSSPFSLEAVDLLEQVGVSAYKIPSGEVTNLPLLEKVAGTGKRVLLSSGMSSWSELDTAVETLQKSGCNDLILLQCTSAYPCSPEASGLNVLAEMKERYGLPVGFSDHTDGLSIPVAAVVLGARVIEKHFTLSQKMYGSDAAHSMEPDSFKKLVSEIRDVEKALNTQVDKDHQPEYLQVMKRIFEKSIVSSRDIPCGAVIHLADLTYRKPGDGISARMYKTIAGKKATRDIPANTKLQWDMLE